MMIIIIGVVVIWRYFVLDRRPVTSSKRVAPLCLTLFYVISITIMSSSSSSPSSSSSSSSWGACKLAQRQIHHHQFFVIIAIIVIVMCIYLNLFLSSLWASQLAHHKWKHIKIFGLKLHQKSTIATRHAINTCRGQNNWHRVHLNAYKSASTRSKAGKLHKNGSNAVKGGKCQVHFCSWDTFRGRHLGSHQGRFDGSRV